MTARAHEHSVAAIGLLLILLAFAAATHARNEVWLSKLSLWQDVAAKSPRKSRAHNNLGNCYMLLGRPFPAIEEYRKAIELDPMNGEAYFNIALNLEQVGIVNEAYHYYDLFCRNAPRSEPQRTACRAAAELSARLKGLPHAPKDGPQ